jgi:hypothetical protein
MTSILDEKGVDRSTSLQGVDSHGLGKRTNNGESSGTNLVKNFIVGIYTREGLGTRKNRPEAGRRSPI